MDELAGVFETVSRYFSILSEPVRVRIVHAICQQERTVNDIVAATHATQTTVSRHLALMYREGVVARRREGGFVYYTVSDDALAQICRTVCVHIAARDDIAPSPARGALRIAQAFEPPMAKVKAKGDPERQVDPGSKVQARPKKPGANSASSTLISGDKAGNPSKEKSRT